MHDGIGFVTPLVPLLVPLRVHLFICYSNRLALSCASFAKSAFRGEAWGQQQGNRLGTRSVLQLAAALGV